ncbi:restriction endonuclease subunit S [Psychrobacter immobilis]|uniref:restriction endonuclease subunit S n=1 Tax=Psychrobacter immobilis TaxID=498 RepID=UPI0019180B40|nr:restriction endonuclease subunit S [Psychrobacter immobilis]
MKTNKITVVPRLRFPEFQDGGDWEEKNLIDVADKGVKWSFIGGPFGSNLKASDYTNKGVRVIQLQNIGDGEFVNDSKIYTSVEKADELLANNIYPHDIIMSKMGDPVGRACIIPDTHDRYVMCSDGIRLVVDEDKYSKYFVYSFINSDTFRASVESKSTGSTRKRIGLSHLKNLPLLIPNLPEQQKIADCLSSLDDLINAENEQLDALQEYKAGLLQQLFPAEGETTPKLRFAEFKDDGDWELMELESCLDYLQPTKYIVQSTDYNDKYSTPVLTAGKTFILGYTDEKTGVFSEQIPVIIFDDFTTASKFVDFPFKVKSSAMKILLAKDSFDIKFLYESIQNLDYETGVHKRHWISVFSKIRVAVPKLKEQQKIADCLSSLDNLIQAKDNQIDTLKTHKQGLMQQLFPVMEGE